MASAVIRSRPRFRRMRRVREPRWYLVDGQPRRTLWPPEIVLLKTPEVRAVLELVRAGAPFAPCSDGSGARQWVREFLRALERALLAAPPAVGEAPPQDGEDRANESRTGEVH